VRWANLFFLLMGATGIEPMTSTVSIETGLSILLIRLCSSCTVVHRFRWFSAVNVPKLFPSRAAQKGRFQEFPIEPFFAA
jgi:hypothetical protein